MPFAIEQHRGGAQALVSRWDSDSHLSVALRFGLGAGLYFEYLQRPRQSPSHLIICFNRQLDVNLAARIMQFQNGEAHRAVRAALRENALLFNLDRQPTTALMGMEMLAEQLADYQRIADWQACLEGMASEIETNESAYRRVYVDFLREVRPVLDTTRLMPELCEISDEWDHFTSQLRETVQDPSQLERTSRMLRRIAFREEHFWGEILEATG